ncbi:MAG: hypothetical protein ACRD9Q_00725, partial [Nitrososphaeraceae archaeon]
MLGHAALNEIVIPSLDLTMLVFERSDFHPKTWLSKYRRNSIGHLTIMALFYYGMAFAISVFGSLVFLNTSNNVDMGPFNEFYTHLSLIMVVTAGPIEEMLFFGIPFYATGNHYVALVTGSIWA